MKEINQELNFTIGNYINQGNNIESIKGEDSISSARTMMIINNFSQLPVMRNENNSPSGVITLKRLLRDYNKINNESLVKDFLDTPVYISTNESILRAIEIVTENDYALVKSAKSNGVVGIITAYDIGNLFVDFSQGFLLAGECEAKLRQILTKAASLDELKSSKNTNDKKREIKNIIDLTFNEYITVLNNDNVWGKINTTVDKKQLNTLLEEVRDIRNKIMHFKPSGISPEDIQKLEALNRLLKSI